MNKVTRDIVAALGGCTIEMALQIQARMGENGLDFSECSQRDFNRAMTEAARELLGSELGRSL